jgi:imidazole glycerol-phosphate synthase subunit HisH
VASCVYQNQNITSLVAHKNIWGMQFHVEKSGATGLLMLKQFLSFAGDFKC